MTITPFELVVVSIAVYRATVLLVDDRVFEPLRDWIDHRASVAARRRRGRRRAAIWSSIAWAVTGGDSEPHGCPWCVSIWFGLAAAVLAFVIPERWFVLAAAPLVASAVAGVAHRYTHDEPVEE